MKNHVNTCISKKDYYEKKYLSYDILYYVSLLLVNCVCVCIYIYIYIYIYKLDVGLTPEKVIITFFLGRMKYVDIFSSKLF